MNAHSQIHTQPEIYSQWRNFFLRKIRDRFFAIILICLTFIYTPSSALARPIISGISTNEINIDTKFTGAKILLFGAKGDAGDIAILVRGPKKNYIVNKKGEFFGIWYNQKRVQFDNAYSYYAFFSTSGRSPFNSRLFRGLELEEENINFSGQSDNNFKIEFVNLLKEKQLYSHNSEKVDFLDESLFKVMLNFPKNISSGVYTVEIYLIDNENLSAFQSIPIYVNQVGFSAKIYNMAYNESVFYGVLAVVIAIVFGWLANAIFARFIGK